MSKQLFWTVDGGTRDGKRLFIEGPGTLSLTLDNDDVDQDEVKAALPEIVDALNRHWHKNAAAIDRATRMIARLRRVSDIVEYGDDEGRDKLVAIKAVIGDEDQQP